jgi:hypothetical protein
MPEKIPCISFRTEEHKMQLEDYVYLNFPEKSSLSYLETEKCNFTFEGNLKTINVFKETFYGSLIIELSVVNIIIFLVEHEIADMVF